MHRVTTLTRDEGHGSEAVPGSWVRGSCVTASQLSFRDFLCFAILAACLLAIGASIGLDGDRRVAASALFAAISIRALNVRRQSKPTQLHMKMVVFFLVFFDCGG